MSINETMNINIDKPNNKLRVIDRDNLISITGDEICTINIDDNKLDKFNTLIDVICRIADFNEAESYVYKAILDSIINSIDTMSYEDCININKVFIANVIIKSHLSESTIRRAVVGLTIKKVIRPCYDGDCKVINAKYSLTEKYNIIPHFYNGAEYALIKL